MFVRELLRIRPEASLKTEPREPRASSASASLSRSESRSTIESMASMQLGTRALALFPRAKPGEFIAAIFFLLSAEDSESDGEVAMVRRARVVCRSSDFRLWLSGSTTTTKGGEEKRGVWCPVARRVFDFLFFFSFVLTFVVS